MVLLTTKCKEICFENAKQNCNIQHNKGLIFIFAAIIILCAIIIDNISSLIITCITMVFSYYTIAKYLTGNNIKATITNSAQYNFDAQHPFMKLLNEFGWKHVYKNLNKTVSDTKGLQMKQDKIYATNYNLYNYFFIAFKEWNEYSVNCRGLILDDSKNKVAALSFPKFFNFVEYDALTQKQLLKLFIEQKNDVEITEKMDGSLGTLFYCNYIKKWRIATRGSFASPQAQWANKYLQNECKNHNKVLIVGHTYLVEIIYNENKIIVEYKFEGLILLAAYNENGYEYKYKYLKTFYDKLSPQIGITKICKFNSLNEIMKKTDEIDSNFEGWVVKFRSGLRVKFKGKQYLQLAKALSNITEQKIEEYIVEHGYSLKYLFEKLIPEEFEKMVTNWYNIRYQILYTNSKNIAYDLLSTNEYDNSELGKYVQNKSNVNNVVLRSDMSRSLIFYARKLVDDSFWKNNDNDNDINIEDRVNNIVNEMINNKEWRRKLMKRVPKSERSNQAKMNNDSTK